MTAAADTRRWWTLGATGGVLFIVLLDETVVGVALPTIADDLKLSTVTSHWVVNAYLLVFAGLAGAAGRLGDIVSIKVLFAFGVLLFGLASLACGFAESGAMLVAMRAVQGIGAAIIFPLMLAIIAHAFPPEERGVAIGLSGGIGTLGIAFGPLVGGLFTDLVSWRWIFWINPPIVIAIVLVLLLSWRDPDKQGEPVTFDAPGAVTLIGALGLIVFALMQGPDWGWLNVTVLVPAALGIVVLAAFIAVERRARQPLIDLELFSSGAFTTLNFATFVSQYSKIAVFVFAALYFQAVLKLPALTAGVALMAATVPAMLSAYPAGAVLERTGSRAMLLLSVVAATLTMAVLSVGVHAAAFVWLLPALAVWGVCLSGVFTPALRDVMNVVPAEKRGEAGGINMTMQLLGSTLGMSLSSVLYVLTGAFWPVFALVGLLYAIVTVLTWRFITEAPRAGDD